MPPGSDFINCQVMGKKINGIESDVIMTGGLLLGGYLLVKSILPDFFPNMGISNEDRQNLDQQQTTDPKNNLFNAGNEIAATWAVQNYDWSHFDNSTDYINAAFNDYKHGNMSPANPVYPTFQIYYNLYKALVGHLVSGDQQAIITALNSITNKYQVGVIAEMFEDINGLDFWTVLRTGSFPMAYGLNGTDLSAQVTRLNNLPD